MTQKRINTDWAGWEIPNPVVGQPAIQRGGRKGEVHDMPEEYVAAKKDEKVLVHYPAPAGESLRVARWEPVLLDPDGNNDVEARAKADAEIAELEAKVAQLRDTRPPAPRPYDVQGANEVVLAPTTTGTRLVGESVGLTEGTRLQASPVVADPAPTSEPKPEPATAGKTKP